ncbi:MAG: HlyD family efflux transporter periplasmic adaptor subunit [Anaerolineae bacterium]
MKKIAIFIFSSVFVLSLVSACGSAGQSLGQTGAELPTPTPLPTPIIPEKPTYIVQRGEVINALAFTGRVSPIIEEELAFGRAGTVKTVFIAQGDDVQAGDVIAELDISDLEKAVTDAEIALQTAEFDLQKARLEHTEKLIQAEINLQKEELNEQKAALEKGSSPLTAKQIELQTAQESVGGAAQAYQEALANPNLDQNTIDSLARGLEQAEQQLLLAEAGYNDLVRAQGAAGVDAQIKALDAELTRIEYEKLLQGISPSFENAILTAQANLEEAQGKLTDAKLIAPFSGRILSINIKRGSNAEAFKAVAVIAQLDALELTANLGASDLEKLSIDQPVTIEIRNRPGETLSGFVRTLPYPYGGGSGGDGGNDASNNEKVVRFTLDAEKHPDAVLKLGELADIEVRLEAKNDVLWLSPNAIRRFQGRRFVVVKEGDGQRRVDVRIGIESDERVEILEGVEEGDVLIGE